MENRSPAPDRRYFRCDYSRHFQLKDMVAKSAALGDGFLAKE
jgi:hypothetical protein